MPMCSKDRTTFGYENSKEKHVESTDSIKPHEARKETGKIACLERELMNESLRVSKYVSK